jgi:subtilase family serine protease
MNGTFSQLQQRVGARARLAVLIAGACASLIISAAATFVPSAQAAVTPTFVTLPQVLTPAQLQAAHLIRPHAASAALGIELVIAPNHQAQLNALLAAEYDPHSALYHHWVSAAAFDQMFGPTAAQRAAIDRYMRAQGLQPAYSPSVFLLDYVGTTAAVEGAFHTQINDYVLRDGAAVYANATAPQIPYALSGAISGIIGLDSITNLHPHIMRPQATGGRVPAYGGAPKGTGLTPQQIRSMYNATGVYPRTNGNGISVGVFELSNWKLSDVQAYERQFHLYNTPIQSVYVDGGPADRKGSLEVVLDIDMFLAVAPGVQTMYVYNAPNTTKGYVDELATIARQNRIATLSLSWGGCESDTPLAQRTGEEIYLKELAMEGISVFTSAGDDGAFDCEYLYTTNPKNPPSYANAIEVDDPANNPYVTAVGGTSFFQTFDPGSTVNPSYPAGKEYVWNTLNNCTAGTFTYGGTNYGHCPFGAGGGGNSRVYAQGFYQYGPGVVSSGSQYGAYCHQSSGVKCRALPDVSINADPNSGYGVYCSDNTKTTDCTTTGWQGVGGTSAGAPLWAAIATLGVGWHHHRLGWMNPQLYSMFRLSAGYTLFYHDINHAATITFDNTEYITSTNGHYAVTDGFDMATGIGTPNIYWDVVGF